MNRFRNRPRGIVTLNAGTAREAETHGRSAPAARALGDGRAPWEVRETTARDCAEAQGAAFGAATVTRGAVASLARGGWVLVAFALVVVPVCASTTAGCANGTPASQGASPDGGGAGGPDGVAGGDSAGVSGDDAAKGATDVGEDVAQVSDAAGMDAPGVDGAGAVPDAQERDGGGVPDDMEAVADGARETGVADVEAGQDGDMGVPGPARDAGAPKDALDASVDGTADCAQVPCPEPVAVRPPIGLEAEIGNIPGKLAKSYDWSKYPAYVAAEADKMAALGVRTTRINLAITRGPSKPDIDAYGYFVVDTLVAAFQSRGIDVALTVGYQRILQGGKGVDPFAPWIWTNQAEQDQYEAYLRAMVERYDADGYDDAPGLVEPVTVWQVYNELEAQWWSATQSGSTSWATPDDYATLLQFSAAVIRDEMPDATVVASQYPWPGHDAADFDGDGQPERYMERVAALGGYEGIDLVEIHDFTGDLSSAIERLAFAQQTSGLPVWAGQVLAVNAPIPSDPMGSPTTQAQKLVKLLVGPLAWGAEEAHWWGLQNRDVEGPGIVPVFSKAGLYQACPKKPGVTFGEPCSDLVLFPAGVDFALLAEAFTGFSQLDVIEPLSLGVVPGEPASSRAVVRIVRAGKPPVAVAWDDAGGDVDLASVFPGVDAARITHFVVDEGDLEPTVEEGISGTIALSATPVLIEPMNPAP